MACGIKDGFYVFLLVYSSALTILLFMFLAWLGRIQCCRKKMGKAQVVEETRTQTHTKKISTISSHFLGENHIGNVVVTKETYEQAAAPDSTGMMRAVGLRNMMSLDEDGNIYISANEESISGDTSYEEAISLASRPSIPSIPFLKGHSKAASTSSSSSASSNLVSVSSLITAERTFSPDQFAKNVDDFRLSVEAYDSTPVVVEDRGQRPSSSSSSEVSFKVSRKLRLSSRDSDDSVVVIAPKEATVTETIFVTDSQDILDGFPHYHQPAVGPITPVYAPEIETLLQSEFETVLYRPPYYSQSSEAASEVIMVGHSFSQQQDPSRKMSDYLMGSTARRSSSTSSSSSSSPDSLSRRGLTLVHPEDETLDKYYYQQASMNISAGATGPLSRSTSESSMSGPIQMANRVSVSSEASVIHYSEGVTYIKNVESAQVSDSYSSQGTMVVHMEDEIGSVEDNLHRTRYVSHNSSASSSSIKMATRVSISSSEASEFDETTVRPSDSQNLVHQARRTSSISSYDSESASSQIKMAVRVSSQSSDTASEDRHAGQHRRTSSSASDSSAISQVKMAHRVSESSDEVDIGGTDMTRRDSTSSSSSEATPSRTIAEADLSVPLSQQIFSGLGSDMPTDYPVYRADHQQRAYGSNLARLPLASNGSVKMNGPTSRTAGGSSTEEVNGRRSLISSDPANKKVDIIATSSSSDLSSNEDEESREFRNTIMNFDLATSLQKNQRGGRGHPVIVRNFARVSEQTETSSSGEDRDLQPMARVSITTTDSDGQEETGDGRPNVNGQQILSSRVVERKNSSPVPAPVFREINTEYESVYSRPSYTAKVGRLNI